MCNDRLQRERERKGERAGGREGEREREGGREEGKKWTDERKWTNGRRVGEREKNNGHVGRRKKIARYSSTMMFARSSI